jgi:hypothetical protein
MHYSQQRGDVYKEASFLGKGSHGAVVLAWHRIIGNQQGAHLLLVNAAVDQQGAGDVC